MQTYLNFLDHIMENGVDRPDRTNTGTRSVFAQQMRFDLQEGFPLVTTKKVHLRSIIFELLWFLRGDTNIHFLKENKVSIWDEWADEDGNLGPVYGAQWRRWETPDGKHIDQISRVVESLKKDPYSRRHLVVAFNPSDIEKMALPPCHAFFQFYVADKTLSLQMYQRSADAFLGVPFNIAGYSLLTLMMCQVCGLKPGHYIHAFGDAHIYHNHFEQVKLQLTRTPYKLPQMNIHPEKSLFDYHYDNFELTNYKHHEAIKGIVAV